MPGLLSRILPRELSFFDLFAEQAENIHAAAKALTELLEHYTDVAARTGKIKDLEHKGDTITHNLMRRLDQTFITPFGREDIHELASKMDDVLDLIDAVAGRLVIYGLEHIRPGVVELAKIVLRAAEQVVAAVRVLEKRNHVLILDYCIEINRLENEGDRLCHSLIAQLFVEEKDPVQIIKWKEIIEVLEFATDKCEDVANVLEAVVLKGG